MKNSCAWQDAKRTKEKTIYQVNGINEISITLGIWAIGLLVFTLLTKAGIAIEQGKLRLRDDLEEQMAGSTTDEEEEAAAAQAAPVALRSVESKGG